MVAMRGTTYKMISTVTFTENPKANESPYFMPLVMDTAEKYDSIELMAEDSSYLKRKLRIVYQGIKYE